MATFPHLKGLMQVVVRQTTPSSRDRLSNYEWKYYWRSSTYYELD